VLSPPRHGADEILLLQTMSAHRFVRRRSPRRGIVKALVEAHGGHMAVESEPSRGTKFAFSLPVAPPVGASSRDFDA